MIPLSSFGDELVIAETCAAQYRSGIDISTITKRIVPAISAMLSGGCRSIAVAGAAPFHSYPTHARGFSATNRTTHSHSRLNEHQFKRDGCSVYILPTIACY